MGEGGDAEALCGSLFGMDAHLHLQARRGGGICACGGRDGDEFLREGSWKKEHPQSFRNG